MDYLRPDEKASQDDIAKSKKHDERIKSGVKTVANIGLAATGFGAASKVAGPLASRILPFLSEHIPTALALKGINKVSPQVGGILEKGMQQGLDIKEGLSFLKGQLDNLKNEGRTPEGERNIIQKYSDNLHEYIQGMINQGNSPLDAAGKAKKFLTGKLAETIKTIEKDYKTDFGNIVESIFGKGDMAQRQQSGDPEQIGQSQQTGNPQQMATQGQNPQAKQQILQAMQALSQKLRT